MFGQYYVNKHFSYMTAVPTSELSEKSEDSSTDVSSSDGKNFKKGTCLRAERKQSR